MGAAGSASENRTGGPTGTLGELLYVDKAKPRIREEDWVALVRSISGRDQRALHALYERTHRLVFTLIVRITASREAAEELTVDVFHDVWRRAPAYDPAGGSVVGWVMTLARSRAIDRLRREQRQKRVDRFPNDRGASPAAGPDDALELEEQRRRLRDALMLLTAHERHAIETAFFSGLTYAEAAVRLHQPLGTVKTRIRSGLGKLRDALPREPKG